MDDIDLQAEREGRATSRFRRKYLPDNAKRRPTVCLTSLKGINGVFGGNGGELRHARITGPAQIPTRR